MTWTVELDERAVKELRKLDRQVQRRILSFLRQRIAIDQDPRRLGQALSGTELSLWRYRVGDYRVICQLEDETVVVLVVRIGHRREVYR